MTFSIFLQPGSRVNPPGQAGFQNYGPAIVGLLVMSFLNAKGASWGQRELNQLWDLW